MADRNPLVVTMCALAFGVSRRGTPDWFGVLRTVMMVVGGGVLPLLQGWIADHGTFLASYWVIFVGFAYILFFALIGSRNINKDIITT